MFKVKVFSLTLVTKNNISYSYWIIDNYDLQDELLNYLNNKVLPFISQLDVEILLLVSDCITDSSVKENGK